MARRWPFLLLLAAPLFPAALPGCGRERRQPSEGGSSGPTFVYARGSDTNDADPAHATDGESAILLVNVFDTLVQFRYGGFEVEPALATSWEEAPDHRSMTFRVREGVRFHDGTPCDAEAVAISFERQRDLKHRFHYTDGAYPYWEAMFGSVAKCTAVDAGTVRFEFSEPMPPFFLQLLAMFNCGIVSPKALERGAKWVARNPVGTGPFRFVAWESGQEITLEANPDWWGGKPKIGRLVLKVVPSPKTMVSALQTSGVHGIDAMDPEDVAGIRSNPAFVLHEISQGLSVCYLSLNNEVKPFDDPRVRRAVAMAIDKPRLVRAAYAGLATPISTLLPAGMDGHLAIPDRTRDVEGAKALLREAGVLGSKVRLHYMNNPRPYVPNPDALAAQIREDLREAGLEVELRKEEWANHLPLLQNGEHQMGILGWSPDVPDADNYLYVLLDKDAAKKGSANNVSFYRSEAFHEKVLAARRTYDPAVRRRLYEEAQRIAFEDCPLVPLVAMPRRAATLARVKGFRLEPVSSPRFAWTSLPE